MTALNHPLTAVQPYRGSWNRTAATHLLRRATLAPAASEITAALEMGLHATIEMLLAETSMPSPPNNYIEQNDPHCPLGHCWVEAPYAIGLHNLPYRAISLRAWLFRNLIGEQLSIREKMTFFWQNHFGCRLVQDPKFVYQFNTILRQNALGNFKKLVREVTVSSQMLVALDGYLNVASEPNENYAREFLELYTIGKGPQVAPGDYGTYTEEDVRELARAFSGWRVEGFLTTLEEVPVKSFFVAGRHDKESKTFSHRFNQQTIEDRGENEVDHIIEMVFDKKEVAFFLCRKIYRFFVHHQIDDRIEKEIITPLAQLMIYHNYEIKPVLRALFGSAHFYQRTFTGALVKSPLEFAVSIIKQLSIQFPEDPVSLTKALGLLGTRLPTMQFQYANPPTVAGWQAYYQAPRFSQLWLNAATISTRNNFAYNLTISSFDLPDFSIRCHISTLLDSLDAPENADQLIERLVQLLMPRPLADNQINDLKKHLFGSWNDQKWAKYLEQYLDQQLDATTKWQFEIKIQQLLYRMLSMPEFQMF